jgi:hypothetical protein
MSDAIMSDAIQAGTILIEQGTAMPESVLLEPSSGRWKSVSNLDRKDLDTRINKAGWTFFFMAGEIKISAFGFDQEKAVRRAVKGVITNVETHKYNCLEITEVAPKSFLGIPYVSVCAHARHIQKSSALSDHH